MAKKPKKPKLFSSNVQRVLTLIMSEPGNEILTINELRTEYYNRQIPPEMTLSEKTFKQRIQNNVLPGVVYGADDKNNGYCVWLHSIITLVGHNRTREVSVEEVRALYMQAYNKTIPLNDFWLHIILKNARIPAIHPYAQQMRIRQPLEITAPPGKTGILPPRELKPLSATSVLQDKFVPQHLKQLNLLPTSLQWDASKLHNMELTISLIAKEFIPAVPCTCGVKSTAGDLKSSGGNVGLNGHRELYSPIAPNSIQPDLRFALRQSTDLRFAPPVPPNVADLDETDSIKEYVDTFRHTMKIEYEEKLRLYEHYSLYRHQIRPMTNNTVRIFMQGILDATPSLSISDIVLLRPIYPIAIPQYSYGAYGRQLTHVQNTLEIHSRIVETIRGRNDQPDSIVISWELDAQQKDLLKDPQFEKHYNIRFVPNASVPQKCSTALDWLESLTPSQQESSVKELLFPVYAPIVKPLGHEQMSCDMSTLSDNGNSDVSKPLNEAQESFLRMIRGRTLDPTFESTRPACILTGPAGTGKTKTLISAIADVLGLLNKENCEENKNRVLLCAPSHAAADVLTRRLTAILKKEEIFRMFDSSRPSNFVSGSILPFTCQLPGSGTFTLPAPPAWARFRVVVCTCLDANILFRAQLTNHAIRTKRQCFVSYLGKCEHIGLHFGGSEVTGSKEPFFSHLFIDEAAQATEPEVLCPMSVVIDPYPGEKKVEIALIGDPRQLSPQIYSESAGQHGLGRSFMERILKRPVDCIGRGESHILGPDIMAGPLSLDGPGSSLLDLIRYYANIGGQEQLTVFLTENFRGHPSFLMMPSSLFYYDRLKTAKNLGLDSLSYWVERLRAVEALTNSVEMEITEQSCQDEMHHYRTVHRQTWWPIHFRAVKGKDTSVALDTFSGTDSWQNCEEADAAVGIIDALVQNGGVDPSKIGVMTPYRGQVVAVRQRCREKHYHDV